MNKATLILVVAFFFVSQYMYIIRLAVVEYV